MAVRVDAILGQFWRDDATPKPVQVLEIETWLDVLEPLTEAEIRFAWAEYQRSGPRTGKGRLTKPDAGAIWRIASAVRRADATIASLERRREQDRAEDEEYRARRASRPTAERISQIIAEVGMAKSISGGQA